MKHARMNEGQRMAMEKDEKKEDSVHEHHRGGYVVGF